MLEILNRAGVYVNPAIQLQHVIKKGCQGLVCSEDIAEEKVIAAIPSWYCIAPIAALGSLPGKRVASRLSDVSRSVDGTRVEFSKESLLTVALTALSMEPPNILADYLNFISIECTNNAYLKDHLGDELMQKISTIREINDNILQDTQVLLCSCGLNIDLDRLRRAHELCNSRCVDVPLGAEVFGGAALVPFVDLINHDSNSNIAVFVACSDDAMRRTKKSSSIFIQLRDAPFYVMVLAAASLSVDEELTYSYVDPDEEPSLYNNALYWAVRFNFLPPHLRYNTDFFHQDKVVSLK